jgi:putative ABC transport system permease protein
MKLSSLLRLYRVRVRARLMQELFAVLGIAIGVALLFASQVANTSLDRSVQRLTDGIVGKMRFQLAARSSAGFSEAMLEQVAKLRGVEAAVPVIEQNANVVGPFGREESVDLVGTDPRLADLGGSIARQVSSVPLGGARVFTVTAPVARKLGVSSIRPVRLEIGAATTTALLVPQLLERGDLGLGESPIALATLKTVQGLTAMPGRLTSIYVRSNPRLDSAVRAELTRLAGGTLNVRPADITTLLFRRAAGPVDQSTGLFSALCALVGFLFAFNALMLTAPQRRSLIEDLRLDGYTRGMIVEVLLLDALVLGGIASAVGLLVGELLSSALFSSSPGYLSFAFPIGTDRSVTWWSIAVAVLGGMLAATTGVLAPLRATLAERPAEPSGASAREPRRFRWLLALAAACLVGATAILFAAPQSAILGVVSLTAALLLCLPALLDLSISAFGRLQRSLSSTGSYLALIELRSRAQRTRSLAIAATGAIAVFGSVSIQCARGSLQRGLDASAKGIDSHGKVWVTPRGRANALATTPFEDVAGGALSRLAGVSEVRLYRSSFLDWRDRRIWVVAQPREVLRPIAANQVVDGHATLANERLRAGGWIAVSQAVASEHDLSVGDSFTLPAPRPSRFRVAALITNLGWPPGAMMLNAQDYARAWASADPSAYQLELVNGAAPAAVRDEAQRAIGPASALHAETTGEREQLHYASAAQGVARLSQIRSLVLIAAVLAMAAAMGAMIWLRRMRLADMKVDGFSRSVLWRALLWESTVLLGLGCALGAAYGAYGQLMLSRALSVVTGFPVIEASPLPAAIANLGLITAVAVAIVAVPGYVAARVRPAIGLQE